MFPRDLTRVTTNFELYLFERLGGTPEYTKKRGKQSLLCRHAHLPIGPFEASRWLDLMAKSIEECEIKPDLMERLQGIFNQEIEQLIDPLLELWTLPLNLLRLRLQESPDLIAISKRDKTLLCGAASLWDEERLQLLISMGAVINAVQPSAHGPLYFACNAKCEPISSGIETVQHLLDAGAEINVRSGPTRSSPLHMTARRGNLELAKLLISFGADLEIRDAKGETPLRRAVNCRQAVMVNYLVEAGADPTTPDDEGKSCFDSPYGRQTLLKILGPRA